jgi:octaprenyl-diphosphate synthase
MSYRKPGAMEIEAIYRLVEDDMRAVNARIVERLSSRVELVNQLGHYIVNSGGKRLRPVLVLLAARACGYQGRAHIDLAAIVEFIHTATLLHDDVVDGSLLRRGKDTANSIWGNEASVLTGDFLYSRAFQMMVGLGNMRVMEILADATNTIAEGEVLQLVHRHNVETSEQRYLEVIRCKTAKLFEAAAELGAVIGGRSDRERESMAAYGMHLGTAYQLVDDVLDYSASSDELGKNVGDDLAEGKPTLPLIHTLNHGSAAASAVVRRAIEQGDRGDIEQVIEAIETSGAIAYTSRSARGQSDKAIAALPNDLDARYAQALVGLATFSVSRTF